MVMEIKVSMQVMCMFHGYGYVSWLWVCFMVMGIKVSMQVMCMFPTYGN